jgi:membrane-associated phospholipid phosphatase
MPRIYILVFLLFAMIISMMVITPYDLQWVTYLSAHPNPWFINAMSDSIFELEQPGAGDIVVIFTVVCFLLYCASSFIDVSVNPTGVLYRMQTFLTKDSERANKLRSMRARLEFIVVSSFCCSTLMVKTIKWVMARPRPKKIFWGTRPFNEWYEVGPYFLDEGAYRASFPSGHTASAICLISLAYVLMYTGANNRVRMWGKILLFLVLGFAITMAVARVMTAAHWPTDVTFSIFGGWLLIHILFFYGFKFTDLKDGNLGQRIEYYQSPPFRGIRLCWYLSVFCLSLVGIILGVRHFYYDRWPWLILLSVASAVLLFYSMRKISKEGLFVDHQTR